MGKLSASYWHEQHAAIAAGLSAPVVIRSRGRVAWRIWHVVAALVVPFLVWLLLMVFHPRSPGKGLGNFAEPLLFAPAMPMVALARLRLSRRAFWQAHPGLLFAILLGSLSCIAAAVFFVVPRLIP